MCIDSFNVSVSCYLFIILYSLCYMLFDSNSRLLRLTCSVPTGTLAPRLEEINL